LEGVITDEFIHSTTTTDHIEQGIDELGTGFDTVDINDKRVTTDKDLGIGDTIRTESRDIGINHIRGDSFVSTFDIACGKRRTEAFVHVRADVRAAGELRSIVQGMLDDFGGDVEEVRSESSILRRNRRY
jgi:hypothetical protein